MGLLKLSGATAALGAEEIELKNWIICFGCASEELGVIIFNLSDWMLPPPPFLGLILRTNGL